MIKQLFRNIIHVQDHYAGEGMMLALFFVSLLILAFYYNSDNVKRNVIVPVIIMLALIYVGIPLVETVTGAEDEIYGRFYWIMITPVITAIGLTFFVMGVKNVKNRAVALLVLFPVFMYCGQFKISDAMYVPADNGYRLPQAAVDITDHVLAECDSPMLIVPYTIAYPFRQISSDVRLLYGEDASYGRIFQARDDCVKICEQMELTTPDLNCIMEMASHYSVDYILFDTVYTEMCPGGNINIYGYPSDENYVGDRTPTIDMSDLQGITVIEDDKGIYWDLSAYGLEYDGMYGQYILYKFV